MGMAVHVGFLFILDLNCQENVVTCTSFSKQWCSLLELLDMTLSSVLSKCFLFIKIIIFHREYVTGYPKWHKEVAKTLKISPYHNPLRVTVIIQLIISDLEKEKNLKLLQGQRQLLALILGVDRLEDFEGFSFLWKITHWIWLFLYSIFFLYGKW